jgi:peptidoglycan/LPS O-acetylase OafA/YrhL
MILQVLWALAFVWVAWTVRGNPRKVRGSLCAAALGLALAGVYLIAFLNTEGAQRWGTSRTIGCVVYRLC